MQIKKVGVLGCGLMGSGIAQVSAVAGYDVTVLEQEQKFLDKGFAGIEKSLAKFAEKGTLKEPVETVRGRLLVLLRRNQLLPRLRLLGPGDEGLRPRPRDLAAAFDLRDAW